MLAWMEDKVRGGARADGAVAIGGFNGVMWRSRGGCMDLHCVQSGFHPWSFKAVFCFLAFCMYKAGMVGILTCLYGPHKTSGTWMLVFRPCWCGSATLPFCMMGVRHGASFNAALTLASVSSRLGRSRGTWSSCSLAASPPRCVTAHSRTVTTHMRPSL